MFEIYMITFENNKSYIGYTKKGVMNRIHKHKTNAEYGINTHLYKAIRKYGMKNIKIKILDRCSSKKEAIDKEKFYIDKYDTYHNGYNLTIGGDGGWCVKNIEEWKRKLSIINTLDSNNKWSGFSDDDIVLFALQYFISNNYKLICKHWYKYCKEKGYPQHYSKNRFNGRGFKGLIEKLKIELDKNNIPYNEYSFKQTYEERYGDVKNKTFR